MMKLVVLITFLLMARTEGSLHSSKELLQGRPSLNWDKYLLEPVFDPANRRRVVAAAGSTAFLHCKINHLADRAVTWIRRSDVQVLTVNSFTYTTDPRFTAHSNQDADEWVLKIASADVHDSGGYECQVSTETKMSLVFDLEVIEAEAQIPGPHEVFMSSGGDLILKCSVGRITHPPEFILWYRGHTVINYSDNPLVSVTISRARKASRLYIKHVRVEDSGNYTCSPANAKPASVAVHVMKEERPAAMQHGDLGARHQCSVTLVTGCLLLLCAVGHLINARFNAACDGSLSAIAAQARNRKLCVSGGRIQDNADVHIIKYNCQDLGINYFLSRKESCDEKDICTWMNCHDVRFVHFNTHKELCIR